MENLTHKEILIVAHSLGIDLAKAVLSDKLKDKKLPIEFYRNYFNTSTHCDNHARIMDLIRKGYMEHRETTNYYHVTEDGINQFKIQFKELAVYRKPQERDKEYLSHQINFYCRFYNYQYGENPASCVFEDFQKYYWQKHYMSHTMTDVVRRFEPKLKKLFPKPKAK